MLNKWPIRRRALLALMVPLILLLGSTEPVTASPSQSSAPGTNSTSTGFLTVAEAAKLGIEPGKPGRNGTVPEISTVNPDSASGCNQSVCIWVTGGGLHVDFWKTQGYSSEPICTFAAYWVNGRVDSTSNQVCGGAFTTYTSWWNNPGWFLNNTQLCNTWIQIPGKPCETVHS